MRNLQLEEVERYGRSVKPGSLPYIWKGVTKNSGAIVGLVFIVLILILSFISPLILKYDYWSVDMMVRFTKPNLDHLFGCDELGRDILSRVLFGARYTLAIGFGAVAIAGSIGMAIGAIAGYLGGKIDAFLMRVLDVIQSFPGLVFAIAISAALGTGIINTILAIGIAFMPPFARLMRANILSIRGSEFIEAAHLINCSTPRIVFKYLIQNTVSPLIVMISLQIAQAGLTASMLSFLGLGVKEPLPEWGTMISASRQFIRDYPHMVVIPGLFIMITVLSLNLVGDAIRDALDPKLRD